MVLAPGKSTALLLVHESEMVGNHCFYRFCCNSDEHLESIIKSSAGTVPSKRPLPNPSLFTTYEHVSVSVCS